MLETWVRSLGQEDPLEKKKTTDSSNLAWKISWKEEHGGLQSIESIKVKNNWVTSLSLLAITKIRFLSHLGMMLSEYGIYFDIINDENVRSLRSFWCSQIVEVLTVYYHIFFSILNTALLKPVSLSSYHAQKVNIHYFKNSITDSKVFCFFFPL